ncbi:NAD(P)H-dependent flavin oxidoreductase [Nanoarchaeota archaeon]
MSLERTLSMKNVKDRYPIVQGGMGIGISLYELAAADGREGGIGTISSACLDQLVPRRLGLNTQRMDMVEATEIEVADTKRDGGVASINIMVAVFDSYENSVQGAVNGGVDVIISGAGLPKQLPAIVKKFTGTNDHDINLVPIVSSARAFEIICKIWKRHGYRPDAVVLEGPRAGGHLGWSYEQVKEAGNNFLETYDMFDALLNPVLDVANAYKNDSGPIPVIVAGGIYTHQDILYALSKGAAAVQMGTRFAATVESGASPEMKQAYVNSRAEDVALGDKNWGSPCGLPFRYLKMSPLAVKRRRLEETFEGDLPSDLCICTTLMSAIGVDNTKYLGKRQAEGGMPIGCPERYVIPTLFNEPCPATGKATTDYSSLFTCGTEVHRVDRIIPVAELMKELIHG